MTSHMSNLFILDLFLVYIVYMKASTFIFLKFIKVYLPKLIFFDLIKTTFLAFLYIDILLSSIRTISMIKNQISLLIWFSPFIIFSVLPPAF